MDYRLLWSCFLYFLLASKSCHNTSVQNTTQSFSTVGQTGLTPSSSYMINATVANASNVSFTTVHSSSETVSTSKKDSNITPSINASNINNNISTPSNFGSSNYAIAETTPAYFTPSSEQPLSTYNTQYATSSKLAPSYSTATNTTTTTTRKTATSTTDTVSLTTYTPTSTATPSISHATPPLDTIYTTTSTATPSISHATPPLDTIYTTTSTPTTPTPAALTDTMYNITLTTMTSTSTITTPTPHAISTLGTTTSTSTFTSTIPTAAPTDTIMRTNTITTSTITSTSTNLQTTTYQITSAITSATSFTNSSQTSFTTSVVSSKSTSTYSFTTKPPSTQLDSPTTVGTTTTIQSSAGESVTTEHSPSSSTARLTISTLIITPSPSSTAKIATSIDSTSKIVLPFTTESAVTILSTVKHTMSTITPPSTKAAGTANKSTISASYFATKPTPGFPSITKYKPTTIHTITSVTKPTEMSSMTGVTVSIATEPTTTGGTTNIPKVFFVIASVNLKWNAQYGILYTEESKKLKYQLETALRRLLKALDRFIDIHVTRFFKGSVKFESEVYFDQSSSVNVESLSTKIESTDIEKLGKIEVIKVERNIDNSTVQNSKPLLQPWMIVAIAAGAVVLIYTIILIILMVKFRRLKRQSTLIRSRSSTLFDMTLMNNSHHGIALEDNEIETFSWRKTSTIGRPELQTFASIEEASDDKKDGGNDVTSNHDNHSPVITFNAGSDSSGSINESKEKDDVSEQIDSEAGDEMNEDEAEAKKEKEPEPGEQDRLVEKESNVSPFY